MLQSSLAYAQRIYARGNAKSAKNVLHYNTQMLAKGNGPMRHCKSTENAFHYNPCRCRNNKNGLEIATPNNVEYIYIYICVCNCTI